MGDNSYGGTGSNTSRRLFLRLAAATGVVAGIGTTAFAQAGEITLNGEASGWVGTAPAEIEGETNPTLRLRAGETYTLTWTNADGAPHNVVIVDADGNALERTEILDQEGETQSLEFEATEEMATYYCEVHPDSMRGEITTDDATAETEEQLTISDAFSAGELTGDQLTEPVETAASGAALFGLGESGEELHYVLLVSEIEGVTQAHIHQGGEGEAGDVVAWLFGQRDEQDAFVEPLEQGVSGSGVLAEGTITEDGLVGPLEGESLETLLNALREEAAYVNVHTEANPGGEIRGQIAPVETVTVELTERIDATATAGNTLRAEPQIALDVAEGSEDDGHGEPSDAETEPGDAETEEDPAAEGEGDDTDDESGGY